MRKIFGLATFASFILLASCDEIYDPATPVPNQVISKEEYFDFETGERIGKKTFDYNNNGLISREYFTRDDSDYFEEIRYEYDGDGNLLKKKTNDLYNAKYFVISYTYENGLKKSEKYYMENSSYLGPQLFYYYTGNKLDSTRSYNYNSFTENYYYSSTSLYHYDGEGRLSEETYKDHRGVLFPGRKIYRYEYSNLTEACDVGTDGDGNRFEWCTINGYNLMGQLARVSEVSPWSDQLKEELFYKSGRLHEKKVYTYGAYNPQTLIDITLIKYEYF